MLLCMALRACFRLYEELNDYIPVDKRKTTFYLSLKRTSTVKEAILSLKVPPEEVDLILVNGEPATFEHIINDGDRVSVYPIFESLDISRVTKLRDRPLAHFKKYKKTKP